MSRYVYIAGPYTGDEERNVERALDSATILLGAGLYPFVPHLSHFWEAQHAHHYEVWMELDFGWVRRCDAVLRLPGASKGADREVDLARRLGLPVFASPDEVIAWALAAPQEQGACRCGCHARGMCLDCRGEHQPAPVEMQSPTRPERGAEPVSEAHVQHATVSETLMDAMCRGRWRIGAIIFEAPGHGEFRAWAILAPWPWIRDGEDTPHAAIGRFLAANPAPAPQTPAVPTQDQEET